MTFQIFLTRSQNILAKFLNIFQIFSKLNCVSHNEYFLKKLTIITIILTKAGQRVFTRSLVTERDFFSSFVKFYTPHYKHNRVGPTTQVDICNRVIRPTTQIYNRNRVTGPTTQVNNRNRVIGPTTQVDKVQKAYNNNVRDY